MGDKGGKTLILVIGISILVGILIIIFHPDYTVKKNLKTNKYYYPMVTGQGVDIQAEQDEIFKDE